jgi:hypothetical protein
MIGLQAFRYSLWLGLSCEIAEWSDEKSASN